MENDEADGIGTQIFMNSESIDISVLLISNGYVSYDKPYLYTYNNRIKKIRVTNKKSTINQYFDLMDTPNPQKVMLSSGSKDLIITIEEVYNGSKWSDTCVNFILALRN